jgi:hypothetical protein
MDREYPVDHRVGGAWLTSGPAVLFMTEVEKFQQWYEAEKDKGLVDIKFDFGDLTGATLESFFKEVNEAIMAKDMPGTVHNEPL